MIAVIDSGGANLASVRFALDRLGAAAVVTTDAGRIREAERVILPGVGAAADVMRRLHTHRLDELIPALRQPVLGICVGMQVLYEHCEEDDVPGLGIFSGRVQRLPASGGMPVPHMGWNTLQQVRESDLLREVGPSDYVYFVHSYAAPPGPDTVASCEYTAPFTAVAARANFHATQFHPERSAQTGSRILAAFMAVT